MITVEHMMYNKENDSQFLYMDHNVIFLFVAIGGTYNDDMGPICRPIYPPPTFTNVPPPLIMLYYVLFQG